MQNKNQNDSRIFLFDDGLMQSQHLQSYHDKIICLMSSDKNLLFSLDFLSILKKGKFEASSSLLTYLTAKLKQLELLSIVNRNKKIMPSFSAFVDTPFENIFELVRNRHDAFSQQ